MSIIGRFPIDKYRFNSSDVLADLPECDLHCLTAHLREDPYKKGEVFFREGSYPAGIYFIREGKVKKYKVDKEGREQIVYIANAGELFGYQALLAEERYPDNAVAFEDCRIAFIPKEDFLNALNDSQALVRKMLKTLSHEFSVYVNSVSLFAQRSVRERLAMQLVIMREKYKRNFVPGMNVEIDMSREDLASLVGTARENILRILKDFKEEGILETKGRRIIITNIDKLLEITNS